MRCFIVLLLAAVAFCQTTLDPEIIKKIFGDPAIEKVTVKPTETPTSFVDKNGNSCKCVPYYLCNPSGEGVDANNASVTGWGELDIRFGEEDECQESVERCCTAPKTEDEVEVPVTDPATLKGCGYRNRKGLDFTIKGEAGPFAQFGEFPWVVALMDETNITHPYAGVGVLIHPQVILTGAHVAYKYRPGILKARAGEWDTQTTGERLKHQERVVSEMYIHKDFQSKNLFNDVALLRLAEPLQLEPHINVVCLPRQDESFDQAKGCVANGWGKNVFGLQGRYAVILKKLEIDMVPHERCQSLLRRTRLGQRFKLHSSFVCAGGEEGKDTCTGDGGAPLACPFDDDRYKLTGLVAWGIGCGGKDIPAVYANVPAFRQWVDDKMAAWGYDTRGYTA